MVKVKVDQPRMRVRLVVDGQPVEDRVDLQERVGSGVLEMLSIVHKPPYAETSRGCFPKITTCVEFASLDELDDSDVEDDGAVTVLAWDAAQAAVAEAGLFLASDHANWEAVDQMWIDAQGRDVEKLQLEPHEVALPLKVKTTMVHKWREEDTRIRDIWVASKEEMQRIMLEVDQGLPPGCAQPLEGVHFIECNGSVDSEWTVGGLQLVRDGKVVQGWPFVDDSDDEPDVAGWPRLMRVLWHKSGCDEWEWNFCSDFE